MVQTPRAGTDARTHLDTGARPILVPAAATPSALLPGILLALMVAGYAVLFGWLSLERYWAYDMHALDIGNMGQAAWNTIHGHPFSFTNMRLPYHGIEAWGTTTRLSFHVEFLFPVISLVYFIYPHPESLLILQTLALAAGAIAVYLLARDVLSSAWLALLFAAAYLLYPTLEGMNLYEFHPVALATPLLLFGFLFMRRGRTIPAVTCLVAAMGTKEEIGLVVAMFGLYAFLYLRQRWTNTGLVVAGIAWSLFAVLVVEHHFRAAGTLSYLHTRYGYLGHGLHGVLHTITHDPGVFFRVLFIWPKLAFLERLLWPAGYLALLAPGALLLGAPTLVLDLFSTDPHMYSGVGDNSAELIAIVMIASILGAGFLLRSLRNWLHPRWAVLIVGAYVLLQALWSQQADGFTPIGSAYQRPLIGAHQHLIDRFVSMIPSSVPVSTQDQMDPHLSSRPYLYLFEDTGRIPPGPPPANYVLLDVSAPTYPLPSYQLHDRAMSLLQHGWGITAADDGLILLQKGKGSSSPPAGFYRYANGTNARIPNLIRGRIGDLELLGYDRRRTDLPNYAVPDLDYSIYLRPTARLAHDLQPVIFETMGSSLINCAREPLGLAWLPTSQWKPGRTYVVRMDPIETDWNVPGTARLRMEMTESAAAENPSVACATLWRNHSKLFDVGTLEISY